MLHLRTQVSGLGVGGEVRALMVTWDKVNPEKELGWEKGGQSHLTVVILRFPWPSSWRCSLDNLGGAKMKA